MTTRFTSSSGGRGDIALAFDRETAIDLIAELGMSGADTDGRETTAQLITALREALRALPTEGHRNIVRPNPWRAKTLAAASEAHAPDEDARATIRVSRCTSIAVCGARCRFAPHEGDWHNCGRRDCSRCEGVHE